MSSRTQKQRDVKIGSILRSSPIRPEEASSVAQLVGMASMLLDLQPRIQAGLP